MDKPFWDIIAEYVKKAKTGDSNSEIARQIAGDGKSELSIRTLRLRVSEYRSGDDKITGITEEDYRWRVSEDTYYIRRKKTEVSFPVKLIDKIFLDYSRHGYNMTSTQVIHKYDLEVEQWYAIKSGLRLFKDSNILSPHTVETTPKDELETVVQAQMEKLFRNNVITEKTYNKVLQNEYKRSIKDSNFRVLELTKFMDTIRDEIPHLPPVQIREVVTSDGSIKEATIVIADLHTGAETPEGLIRTPKFDLEILQTRLKQVAREINLRGYTKVNVLLLGDLIESFTGLNHKNSWKGIQKGMWGSEVVTTAYEVIVNFINELNGFYHMYMVGGNHDRSTSDNKEDVTSEITQILSYFLSVPLQGKVTNFGDIGSFQMGRINIIPTHGHLNLSKQNAAAMSWKYGQQGLFNLILEGHLHSRIVKNKDDGNDFRKIICPSIFSGNVYSDQGGWDAAPGYLVIEENENGMPRIIDESL